MSSVIEVTNLTKTYPSSKKGQEPLQAVKGISFSVEQGEIFGILGPNGAGKTTTLEIIEGLKSQTSGNITVLGLNNITQSNEIKKRIGVQLQSSEYFPVLSLGELLDMFAALYGKKADKKRLLGLVNLEDKEHTEVKHMSGGQQQRFTIAASLAHEPEILFLDEPTTGLDPKARRHLWQVIKEINQKGMTIILTTHYMEEAEFLCNRVAIMDQGKILEIDEPRKLIDRLSDTTQISFLTSTTIDEKIFSDIPSIQKVFFSYPKIILEISSLEHIALVVYTLKKHAIPFSGFTVKTATLEDVYLDLTGKEYQQ